MAALVLMVEDEKPVRDMLRMVLETQGMACEEAVTAEAAWSRLQSRREAGQRLPDVILLDWMLPGASGIEAARRIRKDPSLAHIPIIFLTARDQEDDKIRGLEIGADDYMVKPFSPRELVARIRAVLRRAQQDLTSDVLVVGRVCLDQSGHKVTVEGQPIRMGPTEYKLLQFLMQNPERVFSRSQLLDAVWGHEVIVEERTVDVHIRRLRKALAQAGADGQVHTVRGAGYRFSAEASV